MAVTEADLRAAVREWYIAHPSCFPNGENDMNAFQLARWDEAELKLMALAKLMDIQ